MKNIINFIKRNKWWIALHLASILILVQCYLYVVEILKLGCNVISFKYTLVFYLSIAILLSYIYYFIIRVNRKKAVVTILISVLMLLTTEIILRFVVKNKQTYSEKRGERVYQSPYQQRTYLKNNEKPLRPDLLFRYEPNSIRIESCNEFTYEHEYNNEGIRDDDMSRLRGDNEVRILCLGDSYTEGVGAPQDSTWVQLLENQFTRDNPDKNINCINAGIAGADPIYSYYLMQTLMGYQPDLVLLSINNTEVSEIIRRGGFNRIKNGKPNLKLGPKWEPFFAISFIFRHIAMDVFNYTFELKTKKRMEKEAVEAYDLLDESIHKMADLAQQSNAAFALIIQPTEPEIVYKETKLDAFVEHIAMTTDYNILYILPCMTRKMIESGEHLDQYFWQVDQHLNGRGYKILSECVYERLNMQTQQ